MKQNSISFASHSKEVKAYQKLVSDLHGEVDELKVRLLDWKQKAEVTFETIKTEVINNKQLREEISKLKADLKEANKLKLEQFHNAKQWQEETLNLREQLKFSQEEIERLCSKRNETEGIAVTGDVKIVPSSSSSFTSEDNGEPQEPIEDDSEDETEEPSCRFEEYSRGYNVGKKCGLKDGRQSVLNKIEKIEERIKKGCREILASFYKDRCGDNAQQYCSDCRIELKLLQEIKEGK
mgnify:FL=1